MKNTRFYFLILLLIAGCTKTPTGNSNRLASDIFPNKAGDSWVYRVIDTLYVYGAPEVISEYNMTVNVTDTAVLPGNIRANIWVYHLPSATDTNFVYQHGDTVSFLSRRLTGLFLERQYIVPLRLHKTWQYSYQDPWMTGTLHNITVDSFSSIDAGENHFGNAYHIFGYPGYHDNFFRISEWVADYAGIVKRHFVNDGYTLNPFRHKLSWTLVSYDLR